MAKRSRHNLFVLRRLYGLAQIVDGFVQTFTPWRTGLPLKAATKIAIEKGHRRG